MAQFQDDDIQNTGVEHQMFKMARSPHPDLSCEPMVDKATDLYIFFTQVVQSLRLEYTYARKHTHTNMQIFSLTFHNCKFTCVNSKTNNISLPGPRLLHSKRSQLNLVPNLA